MQKFNNSLEIKIRGASDRQLWKDIPIFTTGWYDRDTLDSCLENDCYCFTNVYNMSVVELRWNYKGSSQGHYYTPKRIVK